MAENLIWRPPLDAADTLWHLLRILVAEAANTKFSGSFGRTGGYVAEALHPMVRLTFSRGEMGES